MKLTWETLAPLDATGVEEERVLEFWGWVGLYGDGERTVAGEADDDDGEEELHGADDEED